jgi:hypothetical protein
LNRYLEAYWDHIDAGVGFGTKVQIRSKLGILNLTTALAEDHDELETVLRIHHPFASHAFGCLTRANILRNSFKYPLTGRNSAYNRFLMTYTDAPQDFAETTLAENDYAHQAKTQKQTVLTIDGSCVDNYHQADRILQAMRYRYREGNFFCSWQSAGTALLLEEGDLIAIHHDAMRGRRNVPLRLEEVKVSPEHVVSIVGRLYDASQYPDAPTAYAAPLVTTGGGTSGGAGGDMHDEQWVAPVRTTGLRHASASVTGYSPTGLDVIL